MLKFFANNRFVLFMANVFSCKDKPKAPNEFGRKMETFYSLGSFM